jgi:hypothetical protein
MMCSVPTYLPKAQSQQVFSDEVDEAEAIVS